MTEAATWSRFEVRSRRRTPPWIRASSAVTVVNRSSWYVIGSPVLRPKASPSCLPRSAATPSEPSSPIARPTTIPETSSSLQSEAISSIGSCSAVSTNPCGDAIVPEGSDTAIPIRRSPGSTPRRRPVTTSTEPREPPLSLMRVPHRWHRLAVRLPETASDPCSLPLRGWRLRPRRCPLPTHRRRRGPP